MQPEPPQRNPLVFVLWGITGVLVIVVAVLAGVLIGGSRQQAGTSASTPTASGPVLPPSPAASDGSGPATSGFDPDDYTTSAVRLDCTGGDFSAISAQAGAGTLVVQVELASRIRDDQQLEILMSTGADPVYDMVATYFPEYNSTHLWDGEDEDSFLPVTSGITGNLYTVEIPLDELRPSQPVRILVNRWTDSGDGVLEACTDQPLVVA